MSEIPIIENLSPEEKQEKEAWGLSKQLGDLVFGAEEAVLKKALDYMDTTARDKLSEALDKFKSSS